MTWANPYMVRDHWLYQGTRGYAAETHDAYERDLGQLDDQGRSLDLLKLQDWQRRRDTAQALREPFTEPPPPLGWIPFIAELAWEATPFHVDAWLNQWKDASPRSRSRRRSAVFSFYEHARAEGIVPGNPAAAIRPGVPAGLPGRVKLTRRQSGMLRSAADRWAPPRDRLLVYLLLAGLRPHQVVGIYLETITREQHRVTSKVPLKGGGTEKWEWPPECVEALDGYLPERKFKVPHTTKDTGPLITSRNGLKIDAVNTPRRIVREVAAAHPGLIDLAEQLTADGVALSLSPFVDDEDQEQEPARDEPDGRQLGGTR